MRGSHFSTRPWLLLTALAATACATASLPHTPTPLGPDRAFVHYPAGACLGVLEIELFERASGSWRPHPAHPRLAPGACAEEPAAVLLNELRVRCADPAGARAPSEWVVGAEVASAAAPCEATAR
jgi:hypothetical protein